MDTSLLKRVKETAYLEGNFITRAGKPTTYYIDKYLFSTQPDVLKALGSALAASLPPLDSFDRIAAPELGAVALAAAVAMEVGKPFIIVRKKTKDYGTQKRLEGKAIEGETVVMIEDILTTGGAVLQACESVTEAGLKVKAIVGVINREEGAFENIQKAGYPVSALFTTTDLRSC
jgi:orotate phosphoribosyltransferase